MIFDEAIRKEIFARSKARIVCFDRMIRRVKWMIVSYDLDETIVRSIEAIVDRDPFWFQAQTRRIDGMIRFIDRTIVSSKWIETIVRSMEAIILFDEVSFEAQIIFGDRVIGWLRSMKEIFETIRASFKKTIGFIRAKKI